MPHDCCLQNLFEKQVNCTPDAIALSCEDQLLTYRELNRQSDRLAHALQQQGIGPDVLVGICVKRSLEMIIGLLGILKAGGAYVPLDPAYPAARLAFMMQDAQIKVLLTQTELLPDLSVPEVPIICPEDDWIARAQDGAESLAVTIDSANLAYLIYTSGSTGRPKGVMVAHQALVKYALAANDYFAIEPNDRILQFASLSFDAAAEEIYPCLLCGATLVLRTDNRPDSNEAFLRRCATESITVLDLPTAYWHRLIGEIELNSISFPNSLRLVILGGEAALPERLATWQAKAPAHIRLVNTYGPTETTIAATYCDLTGVATPKSVSPVPIGKPIANMRVYILDPAGRIVSFGMPGELYIGGDGLARGYLNRPDLTAAVFVPDPFSQTGQRLYKTGDKVRYLLDGNLEFLGRLDRQVKIRGFRIELGEVEAALRQYPAVREAIVVAYPDLVGHYRLVAYVVTDEMQVSSLRDFLRECLPEYMIPSLFMPLEALPLSLNGKIDYRALPIPNGARFKLPTPFVAPQGKLEIQLVQIWEEVLKVEPIGVRDNFFDLGGDSLLATQALARACNVFQVNVPLRVIFESPTIADFSVAIIRSKAEQVDAQTLEQILTALS